MLLTIKTTHQPATELGYLLHKNPARLQSFNLSFGQAHVFYTVADEVCCTVALLLDIDPVGLVRGRHAGAVEGQALAQYVNDRPYVASSFLSVALAQVFGSALLGKCKERPELVETVLPLQAKLAVLPCRGGEAFLRRLFEPLGYMVQAYRHTLDEKFPDWGESSYFTIELNCQSRLRELLSHLYVLVPVLDDDKHYWVGDAEVEKLLRHGAGWLATHPEREIIVSRYLKHRRSLVKEALARLTDDDAANLDAAAEQHSAEEAAIEAHISLNEARLNAVLAVLKEYEARRVIDLGCGEGRLLKVLLREKGFKEIVGMDISYRALEIARERLRLDQLPGQHKERIKLFQGALTYRDERLSGFDAATVIEVIEHLDTARLAAFERVLFEFARPKTVVLTTPNREYNAKWEELPAGHLRHKDHRFEWTRAEFVNWADRVAHRFAYTVHFLPVGPEDAQLGAPTQMGVFTRE
ncbi:MAG: 3' terminal RNA ribose 2'-O-methyltransferase Hen1 [Acidobacteriota bacterium]